MQEMKTIPTNVQPPLTRESRAIGPDLVLKVSPDGMTYLELTSEAAERAVQTEMLGYESWWLRRKLRIF